MSHSDKSINDDESGSKKPPELQLMSQVLIYEPSANLRAKLQFVSQAPIYQLRLNLSMNNKFMWNYDIKISYSTSF